MAVTHADLSVQDRSTDIVRKSSVFFMVFCILCGLLSFILCLLAEAMRSESTWVLLNSEKGGETYGCVFSGSGRSPLLCAVGAFLFLAMAMIVLIAVSKPATTGSTAGTPDSPPSGALTWQACFFFITTWICFAAAEVLLMIGIGIESGHLTKWRTARPSCLIIRQGLLAAAGVFGLTAVFLAAGFYLTVLRAQWLQQEEDSVRREVLDTSILYASPPRSPRREIPARLTRNPNVQLVNESHLTRASPPLEKPSNSV